MTILNRVNPRIFHETKVAKKIHANCNKPLKYNQIM